MIDRRFISEIFDSGRERYQYRTRSSGYQIILKIFPEILVWIYIYIDINLYATEISHLNYII